jgi:uncharacterized membrane protein YhaH (DUF805 family)
MATVNPYRSPTAAVGDQTDEYGEIHIFSPSGRIGRIRYIGYSIGLALVIGVIGGILMAVAKPLGMLTGIAILVVQTILTIQRCHDFNANGWLCLLMFVPLANLVFWFLPGTDGSNRYGPPPPPNSALVVALGLVVPLILVAVMAAVAIPAYQSFVEKSRAAQQR